MPLTMWWSQIVTGRIKLRAWIVYRQKDGQTDRRSGTHNVACSQWKDGTTHCRRFVSVWVVLLDCFSYRTWCNNSKTSSSQRRTRSRLEISFRPIDLYIALHYSSLINCLWHQAVGQRESQSSKQSMTVPMKRKWPCCKRCTGYECFLVSSTKSL